MAELKKTTASVADFLAAIKDDERRKDCETVVRLMKKVTKSDPAMWGPSIVGFGAHNYRNSSGKEVAWFKAGFSPRKRDASCLYIKRLGELDMKVLEELIAATVKDVAART